MNAAWLNRPAAFLFVRLGRVQSVTPAFALIAPPRPLIASCAERLEKAAAYWSFVNVCRCICVKAFAHLHGSEVLARHGEESAQPAEIGRAWSTPRRKAPQDQFRAA